MSRIGRLPVPLPAGVEVSQAGTRLAVKGPKGELAMDLHPDMVVRREEGTLLVERPSDEPRHRALHGMTRALVANMVTGVTTGFLKKLEIVGVGYTAELKSGHLNLKLGFTHQIVFQPPAGISIVVPKPTQIEISGLDRALVGEVAALVRGFKPPEPYKGKGIRYSGEYIEKKAGKTGKK
ncbi:MAG: 50S ribosomal protein L6 [bacterium]|nr:50S ribosomal protein L6 [bacterium]